MRQVLSTKRSWLLPLLSTLGVLTVLLASWLSLGHVHSSQAKAASRPYQVSLHGAAESGSQGATVYVGSFDAIVYALRASNGALRWRCSTGGVVQSSPAVVNGTVYVGSDDDHVYALNAATGALRWSFTTGSVVRSSPAVVNGTVYIGSDDGHVYAL